MADVLLTLVVVALPVTAIGVIIATLYLRRRYNELPVPRSWIMRALVQSATVKAVCGVYLTYIAVDSGLHYFGSTIDLPSLPVPWGTIVFGFVLEVLFAPPIYYAISIEMMRRRARRKRA